ncbi:1949_t:CDS:2 [Funneliformis geosporum]|nr:1949_t:CDS:2 [Funneliformis geosporum]
MKRNQRCLKHADYDNNNQPNYRGLDDIDEWFKERDAQKVRNNASEWKNCKTEEKQSLELLKPKDLSESLSVYYKYTDEEYRSFRLLSNIEDGVAFGFKSFPESFLKLLKKDVIPQKDF